MRVGIVDRGEQRRAVLCLQRQAVRAHRLVPHLERRIGERAGQERAALRLGRLRRGEREDGAAANLDIRIVVSALHGRHVHGARRDERQPGEAADLGEVGVRRLGYQHRRGAELADGRRLGRLHLAGVPDQRLETLGRTGHGRRMRIQEPRAQRLLDLAHRRGHAMRHASERLGHNTACDGIGVNAQPVEQCAGHHRQLGWRRRRRVAHREQRLPERVRSLAPHLDAPVWQQGKNVLHRRGPLGLAQRADLAAQIGGGILCMDRSGGDGHDHQPRRPRETRSPRHACGRRNHRAISRPS